MVDSECQPSVNGRAIQRGDEELEDCRLDARRRDLDERQATENRIQVPTATMVNRSQEKT